MKTLKLGALEVPALAALNLQQTYSPIGGESIFRTIGGTGIKQMTWDKTRITISGSGWLPSGLRSLNTKVSMTLACTKAENVPAVFATRQATLPVTRRSDAGHTPWGIAILANGKGVRTGLSLAGNVATLDAVAGAVAYLAMYLPQFTVWAMRPTESGERGDASYRWELECEEV